MYYYPERLWNKMHIINKMNKQQYKRVKDHVKAAFSSIGQLKTKAIVNLEQSIIKTTDKFAAIPLLLFSK